MLQVMAAPLCVGKMYECNKVVFDSETLNSRSLTAQISCCHASYLSNDSRLDLTLGHDYNGYWSDYFSIVVHSMRAGA